MEYKEIDTDVTPGISRTSLWAIIVILLIVVGVETAYIFVQNKPVEEESESQLNQNPLNNNLLGTTNANTNPVVSQSPNKIPTLIPTTVPSQGNNNASRQVNLNRTYHFPIKNNAGDSTGNFEFLVKNYELTSKVVVNNFYTATVTGDKKILAVNLEISNNTEQAFKIIARDYVRLSIDSGKWIAPDIHNDPVEMRPQSSKVTVVGFPLNRNDKNLRLQIGDLDGEKEIFDLTGI